MTFAPYVITFLVGLWAGWLTNVIAERFPIQERALFGPLHCVKSGERLGLRDTFPMLGYALQRGKCRHCGKALPLRFPAVELAVALAFVIAWPRYETDPLYVYAVNAFYIFLLATIALIDWRYRLIFPIMTWGGCIVAIIVGLVSGMHADLSLPDGISSVILGALFGGGIFYAVYWIAYGIYRRRALGFGDVLLAILIGAIIGMPRVASALFLGAVLGGVVAVGFFLFGGKRWREFIPYGTTLCVGVILVIIWGQEIWGWGPFWLITWGLRKVFGVLLYLLFNQNH